MASRLFTALKKSLACFKKGEPTLEKKYIVPEEDLLGQGTFAKVFKGRNRKTKLEVAVKVIDKANSRRDLLNTEIWILQNFGDHPNIVNFYDMFETETEVQLVMELMPGGELFDLLDENGPYGEADAAKYLHAIASGLAYLHAGNVVHRDLKPENLLLTSKGPGGVLKISDFGLAKILIDEELMKVACGTWIYCAPEVLLLKQRRWGQYDINCDMFSVGCILFIIMSGYHPFDFDGNDDEELMQECILSDTWDFDDPAWDEVSQHAKDLIEQMLRYNPQERISAAQLAVHPWTCGRSQYGRLSANVDKNLRSTRESLRNNRLDGAEMVRRSLNVVGVQDADDAGQPKASPEMQQTQTQSSATLLVPGRQIPKAGGSNALCQPIKADGTGGTPLMEVDAGTGGGGLQVPRRRLSGTSNMSTRSCPQRRQAAGALPEEDQHDAMRNSLKADRHHFPEKRARPCQPGADKPGVPSPKSITPQEPLQSVRAANGARWTKYNLKGNVAGANRTGDKAECQSLLLANDDGKSPTGLASPASITIAVGDGAGGGTGSASAAPQKQDEENASEVSSIRKVDDKVAKASPRAGENRKSEWGGKKKKKPEPKKEAATAASPKAADNLNAQKTKPPQLARKMTIDEWKAKRVPRLSIANNANVQASSPDGQAMGERATNDSAETKASADVTSAASFTSDGQRSAGRGKSVKNMQSNNSRFTQKKKTLKAKEKGASEEVGTLTPKENKDAN